VPATRPTRTDALLAVAVFCLVAAAVVTDVGPFALAALAYAFAAGFAALVLCARRWPTAALLATAAGIVGYYVVDLPPIGLAAPVAAALYVAADRGRVRTALVVAAALLAASMTVRLREGDDVAVVLGFDLGAEAALMVAVIALGDAVRSRRSLRAEMARQAAEAVAERRREAARQVDAERVRIARELHDTLGHTMSVITLQSAVAAEALADGAAEETAKALAAVREAAGGAMAELRATVGILRDLAAREPAPGIDRLAALADGVTRSGLPVELHVTGDVGALPAIVRTTAHRVVQEALTNALRHARATRVVVTVRASATGLTLEVLDDGCGTPDGTTPGDAGHGLRGMSERVALLGGTVHAGNAAGGGFRVHADLPRAGSRT
jgi:signal transduction histidine kinase